uniref:Uncharacterized protein n=1 Tax=Anguilla anguilla TaxID=7936 RepID=A0A0E9WKR4_ANGAN
MLKRFPSRLKSTVTSLLSSIPLWSSRGTHKEDTEKHWCKYEPMPYANVHSKGSGHLSFNDMITQAIVPLWNWHRLFRNLCWEAKLEQDFPEEFSVNRVKCFRESTKVINRSWYCSRKLLFSEYHVHSAPVFPKTTL